VLLINIISPARKNPCKILAGFLEFSFEKLKMKIVKMSPKFVKFQEMLTSTFAENSSYLLTYLIRNPKHCHDPPN
jgi:hypothetical protein